VAKAVARDGLGVRVKDLAGERELSVAAIARLLEQRGWEMSKFKLYGILKKPGWPPVDMSLIVDIAEILKVDGVDLFPDEVRRKLTTQTSLKGEDTIVESRIPFGGRKSTERYAQPITQESIAVQAIGRIEHYLAALADAESEHSLRIAKLIGAFRAEIEYARHELLKRIEHDDKGRKV